MVTIMNKMSLLSTRSVSVTAKRHSALSKIDMLELFRSTKFANTVQKAMVSTIENLVAEQNKLSCTLDNHHKVIVSLKAKLVSQQTDIEALKWKQNIHHKVQFLWIIGLTLENNNVNACVLRLARDQLHVDCKPSDYCARRMVKATAMTWPLIQLQVSTLPHELQSLSSL